MDFLKHVMLRLRQFLDPLRNGVQLAQHGFLPRGKPVHPPKTNDPTTGPDPGQGQRNCLHIEVHVRSVPAAR
jgi:hypothetical protein